jgi:NADH:ubiquinone oxidoreductase subunit
VSGPRPLGALRERPAASFPAQQVDQTARPAICRAMNIGTWLFTRRRGRQVGSDAMGNRYFEEKRLDPGRPRVRRWVIYAGAPEASVVPPEWHAWLHYTTEAPLPETGRKPWQKPHEPNATGTPLSYRPPGHDYKGGHRARATGDYEAWTPS